MFYFIISLLTSLALVNMVSTDSCQFPAFLQAGDSNTIRWMYRVHNQGGRGANTYFYTILFKGSLMTIASTIRVLDPPDAIDTYQRHCTEETPDGFIATHVWNDNENRDNNTRYLCIKFQQVSEFVALLSESALSEESNQALCAEAMIPDYWPMISVAAETATITPHLPESLIGGFQFSATGKEVTNFTCFDNVLRPPRMEAACELDLDLSFSFGEHCSIPDLRMNKIENVHTLGNWTMSDSTFMVLKRVDSVNLWCLRIPSGENLSEFTALLFLDVICHPSPKPPSGTKYIELSMKRIAFDNLCIDTSDQCTNNITYPDVCSDDGDTKNYCMDHCDRCTPVMRAAGPDTACNFGISYHGAWIHVSPTKREEFLIIPSKIYMDAAEPLLCMMTNKSLSMRYPLMYLGTSGCFPSFTCIEFNIINPGFVTYTIGHAGYWPSDILSSDDPYDLFCKDTKFEGDVNPQTNKYVEPSLHSLVFDPRGTKANLHTTPCNIAGFNASIIHFSQRIDESNECQGAMTVPCDNSSAIQVLQSTCTYWPPIDTVFHCMGSFMTETEEQIVITVGDFNETTNLDELLVHCWMFSEDVSALYVLPWADCSSETYEQLVGEGLYDDIAETFIIDDIYEEGCVLPEETTTQSLEVTSSEEITTEWDFPDLIDASPTIQPNSILLLIFVLLFNM